MGRVLGAWVGFAASSWLAFGLFIGFLPWGTLAVLRLGFCVYNCLFARGKSLRRLTFVVVLSASSFCFWGSAGPQMLVLLRSSYV